MKDQKLKRVFLSFLGTGYAPKMPGTVGSIATLPLMYLISLSEISRLNLIIIIVVGVALASKWANDVQIADRSKDPQWIVMDEVLGMLVTWLVFYPLFNFKIALGVLIAFRIFDIIKIFPASYFDKKVAHGFGTIFDDILSAGYACLILVLAQKMGISFL